MRDLRALQRVERAHERAPVFGHRRDAAAREQIAAVEQQPRVDVPRHAVQRALDLVGAPDALEVIVGNDAGGIGPRLQRLERAERGELGDPGVAELRDVGRGVAGEGRQQLFMRRAPRQLFDAHAQRRVLALERGEQLAHHLAFAAHRPEAQRRIARCACAAGRRDRRRAERNGARQAGAAQRARHNRRRCSRPHQPWSSQPPVKPARCRPRRNCADRVIVCHTVPSVKLAIIARIGPWSMAR